VRGNRLCCFISRKGRADASESGVWEALVRGRFPFLAVILPLTALVLGLVEASLRWRMQHDSPLMLYAGFLMDRYGFVPYRDFFDMNMPGTHLFYYLLGHFLGYTDRAFRFADIAYLAAISGVTWALLKDFSRRAALAGVALFVYYYLLKGQFMSLQREYLLLLPIGLAALLATSLPAMNEVLRWALMGFLAGVSFLVKPHSLIGLVVILVYRVYRLRSRGSRGLQANLLPCAAGLLAGMALPVGCVFFWLARANALPQFMEIAVNYWPLYGQLSGAHQPITGPDRATYLLTGFLRLGNNWLIALYGLAGGGFALLATKGNAELRARTLMLGGLACAFAIYPLLAGKFWSYHWLPFCYSSLLVGSLVFLRTDESIRGPVGPALYLLALFSLMLCVALPAPQAARELFRSIRHVPLPPPKGGRVDAIADFLRREMRPGDTVQPLDWTGGAVHAMLLARAKIATNFIYDFHFYHHVSSPYIQSLRRRFLSQMELARPRFIVEITGPDKPWPSGADTTRNFPGLREYLRKHYRVVQAEERLEYVIYERRGEHSTAPVSAEP